MTTINTEFNNAGGLRTYPFDESSSLVDDTGQPLVDNVIVDGRMVFSSSAVQRRLFMSSLYVGSQIVSVTIGRTDATIPLPAGGPFDSEPTLPEPIVATLSLSRPIVPGRPYAVTPMTGVELGGWLVFGPGVDEPGEARIWRFSNARQALFNAGLAIRVPPNPVSGLGKESVSEILTGLVRLAAGSDLEVLSTTRVIDGLERACIVIRLKSDMPLNRMRGYLGDCGGSPAADSCGRQPIFKINTVPPDCDGNITIFIQNVQMKTIANDLGVILQTTTELPDICISIDELGT